MPELIEVELSRRLAQGAIGRRIATIVAPDAWYLKGGASREALGLALCGRVVAGTRRIGKLLLLDCDAWGLSSANRVDTAVLGIRFGMTGRLILDGVAALDRLEYGSSRAEPAWDRFSVGFENGGELIIRDPRRLGGVELDPAEDRLGPDASLVSTAQLAGILAASSSPLKVRLMDQRRVAGLGNLLTDEVLWRSGLDPMRSARSLTIAEIDRLHRELGGVLDELTARGGSHTGDLQEQRHRSGHCSRCAVPLLRRRIGGRTTYSCLSHQT